MHASCTTQGWMGAMVAVACVLSLSLPATASAGVWGDLSGLVLDRSRCCGATGLARVTEQEADGLAAESASGGQVRPGGIVFTQSESAAPDEPQNGQPLATELPDPDPTREDAKVPVTVPEETADAFKGSVEPAGPDLTPSEEEELISRGWE